MMHTTIKSSSSLAYTVLISLLLPTLSLTDQWYMSPQEWSFVDFNRLVPLNGPTNMLTEGNIAYYLGHVEGMELVISFAPEENKTLNVLEFMRREEGMNLCMWASFQPLDYVEQEPQTLYSILDGTTGMHGGGEEKIKLTLNRHGIMALTFLNNVKGIQYTVQNFKVPTDFRFNYICIQMQVTKESVVDAENLYRIFINNIEMVTEISDVAPEPAAIAKMMPSLSSGNPNDLLWKTTLIRVSDSVDVGCCEPFGCEPEHCENGGTCVPLYTPHPVYLCACVSGFTGPTCAAEHTACNSQPCMNGGTCEEILDNKFMCACPAGFFGTTCNSTTSEDVVVNTGLMSDLYLIPRRREVYASEHAYFLLLCKRIGEHHEFSYAFELRGNVESNEPRGPMPSPVKATPGHVIPGYSNLPISVVNSSNGYYWAEIEHTFHHEGFYKMSIEGLNAGTLQHKVETTIRVINSTTNLRMITRTQDVSPFKPHEMLIRVTNVVIPGNVILNITYDEFHISENITMDFVQADDAILKQPPFDRYDLSVPAAGAYIYMYHMSYNKTGFLDVEMELQFSNDSHIDLHYKVSCVAHTKDFAVLPEIVRTFENRIFKFITIYDGDLGTAPTFTWMMPDNSQFNAPFPTTENCRECIAHVIGNEDLNMITLPTTFYTWEYEQTFDEAGSYEIIVICKNMGFESMRRSVFISVEEPMSEIYLLTKSNTVPVGEPVIFVIVVHKKGNAPHFEWYFDDEKEVDPRIMHHYIALTNSELRGYIAPADMGKVVDNCYYLIKRKTYSSSGYYNVRVIGFSGDMQVRESKLSVTALFETRNLHLFVSETLINMNSVLTIVVTATEQGDDEVLTLRIGNEPPINLVNFDYDVSSDTINTFVGLTEADSRTLNANGFFYKVLNRTLRSQGSTVIKLSSFNEGVETGTKIVTVSVVNLICHPTVTITNAGHDLGTMIKYHRQNALNFGIVTNIACRDRIFKGRKWSLHKVDDYSPNPVLNNDNLVLLPSSVNLTVALMHIPGSVLDFGFYVVTLDVTILQESRDIQMSDSAWFKVIRSALQPSIVGGSSRSHFYKEPLVVDGSKSRNPNGDPLIFEWSCESDPFNTAGICKGFDIPLNDTGKIIRFSGNAFTPGVTYTFSMTIKGTIPTEHPGVAEQVIFVTTMPSIDIICKYNCLAKTNPQEKFLLEARCAQHDDGHMKFKWDITLDNTTQTVPSGHEEELEEDESTDSSVSDEKNRSNQQTQEENKSTRTQTPRIRKPATKVPVRVFSKGEKQRRNRLKPEKPKNKTTPVPKIIPAIETAPGKIIIPDSPIFNSTPFSIRNNETLLLDIEHNPTKAPIRRNDGNVTLEFDITHNVTTVTSPANETTSESLPEVQTPYQNSPVLRNEGNHTVMLNIKRNGSDGAVVKSRTATGNQSAPTAAPRNEGNHTLILDIERNTTDNSVMKNRSTTPGLFLYDSLSTNDTTPGEDTELEEDLDDVTVGDLNRRQNFTFDVEKTTSSEIMETNPFDFTGSESDSENEVVPHDRKKEFFLMDSGPITTLAQESESNRRKAHFDYREEKERDETRSSFGTASTKKWIKSKFPLSHRRKVKNKTKTESRFKNYMFRLKRDLHHASITDQSVDHQNHLTKSIIEKHLPSERNSTAINGSYEALNNNLLDIPLLNNPDFVSHYVPNAPAVQFSDEGFLKLSGIKSSKLYTESDNRKTDIHTTSKKRAEDYSRWTTSHSMQTKLLSDRKKSSDRYLNELHLNETQLKSPLSYSYISTKSKNEEFSVTSPYYSFIGVEDKIDLKDQYLDETTQDYLELQMSVPLEEYLQPTQFSEPSFEDDYPELQVFEGEFIPMELLEWYNANRKGTGDLSFWEWIEQGYIDIDYILSLRSSLIESCQQNEGELCDYSFDFFMGHDRKNTFGEETRERKKRDHPREEGNGTWVSCSEFGTTGDRLFLHPNCLEPGKAYTIHVNAKGHDMNINSEYKILVNSKPKVGTCKVTPAEGQALVTTFNIVCVNFADLDGPLMYQFFYDNNYDVDVNISNNLPKTEHGLLLKQRYTPTSEDIFIPPGDPNNHYNGEITIIVSDYYGLYVNISIPVKVTPPPGLTRGDLERLVVSEDPGSMKDLMTVSGDYDGALNLANTIGVLLNTEKATQMDVADRAKVRSEIVSMIREMPRNEFSMVKQTIGTLNVILEGPPQEIPSSILIIAGNLLNERTSALFDTVEEEEINNEQIYGATKTIMKTVSSIIELSSNKDSYQTVFIPDAKPQPLTMEKKIGCSVAMSSLETATNVGNNLLKQQVSGEPDVHIDSTNVGMWLRKIDNEHFSTRDMGQGASDHIVLPTLNAMGLQNAERQDFSLKMISSRSNMFQCTPHADMINTHLLSLMMEEIQENASSEVAVKNATQDFEIYVQRKGTPESVKSNITTKGFPDITRKNVRVHEMDMPIDHVAMHIHIVRQIYNFSLLVTWTYGCQPTLQDFANTTFVIASNDIDTHLITFLEDSNMTADRGTYYVGILPYANAIVSILERKDGHLAFDHTLFPEVMNYTITLFVSRCLFYDFMTRVWSERGCKVGSKTDMKFVQCMCNHLSFFGASFLVSPNTIDLSNIRELLATSKDNMVVIIFMTVCWLLYLLGLVWTCIRDRKDTNKKSILNLESNVAGDPYGYIIAFYTGLRPKAGTTSNVRVKIHGRKSTTRERKIFTRERAFFQTGDEDWFFLTSPVHLKEVFGITLIIDFAGLRPNWYLSQIRLKDLTTGKLWVFLIDEWFVDEGGRMEDFLTPLTYRDMLKFGLVFRRRALSDLRERHMWFSIFNCPPRTQFTRAQRLTCAFSLLIVAMLINIMFYGAVPERKTVSYLASLIKQSPVTVNLVSLIIGLQSSLMAYPFGFIIMEMFMRIQYPEMKEQDQIKKLMQIIEMEDDVSRKSADDSVSSGETIASRKIRPLDEELEAKLKGPVFEFTQRFFMERHHNFIPVREDHGDTTTILGHHLFAARQLIPEDEDVIGKDNVGEFGDQIFEEKDYHFPRPMKTWMEFGHYETAVMIEEENQKEAMRFKRLYLPPWFVYVAWTITIGISLVCTFFIILYGLTYGYDGSLSWMKSNVYAFTQSTFLLDPLQVVIFTIVMTYFVELAERR